jgi:hypothetical protein
VPRDGDPGAAVTSAHDSEQDPHVAHPMLRIGPASSQRNQKARTTH